ncbi:30S RIBOSOMAL PROTEIN S10 [Mycoplasmopsis pulmonis]|uniref:Small ribosomal subunit protein uS10 n=1 Tax=Mycoplasmopsis pulmonis (strain UAB CTIP) TaxID=272635 RepID=RS10_MYCPU|nr:30S ribosomal protein S10 [Mycoplasmopsis pulmonis]Q98PX9.1 RecName: Full=Small ribosomal subunit protein uS10; AltName: Full=30S ribosomal protein S10 [Mycoplasmopsis pulmonis UAB CTIP]MDZ7293608.1 30S ribosomal protein S10 [Mycoplasmopsis pulmonis]CAC13763.1 30S RIBOSOMAL PROTEIN S10 [Mycoplasmopsis pulmonis]VEU68352.1 30S ribosomal protein S10 [Mycoplasmopsis pulmonis]
MKKEKLAMKFKSFDHKLVDDAVKKVLILASKEKIDYSGPIPLPTKREIFTILRSVHVNKKSREQFERRTYKRFIVFNNPGPKFVEILKRTEMPAGVEVEFKVK